MIQKITQNNKNFWTVNLIMRAKIVNQSSDFPVRRTGSYRHKKSTASTAMYWDGRMGAGKMRNFWWNWWIGNIDADWC